AVPLLARADEAADATGKPGAGHPAEQPAAQAAAPTKEWTLTLGADWYSEYLFRGLSVLGNNAVGVPSVVGSYKGFTASYYGYYGYGKDVVPGNEWYEETDLSLDYTKKFLDDKLSVTAGAIYYVYFDGISGIDTWELYGKASYSCYLNPYIGINWDI